MVSGDGAAQLEEEKMLALAESLLDISEHAPIPNHTPPPPLAAREAKVSGDAAAKLEEEQMLALAENLLASRDFAASKNLAHALKSPPLTKGAAEQVIAVADALLSSQLVVNKHVNSYAVLQLDPFSCDADTIRDHYTRLTRRLRTAVDRLPSAAEALRIVSNAWEVLSDPVKKSLLDAVLKAQKEEDASLMMFWTSCHSCCNVFQYERASLWCRLQCRNCRKVFTAAELPAAPAIVPGTEMYYCSGIAAPLGCVNGNVSSGFNTFYTKRPQAPTCSTAAATGGGGSQTSTPPPPAKTEAVISKSGKRFKVCKELKKSTTRVRVNLKRAVVEDCEGMEVNPIVIDSEEDD